MLDRSLGLRFDVCEVSLSEMKAAAKRADAKLNAVFIAAICDGLYRYHLEHDDPVEILRMAMPISVRADEASTEGGNHFVPLRFEVPLEAPTYPELIGQLHEITTAQRLEPGIGLAEPLSGVLSRMPPPAAAALFESMVTGTDFVTSNVPGSPLPVFLAGQPVLAQYPFGPLTGAAVNVTLISYQDHVHLGIASDTKAVTDPDLLLRCIEAGFEAVLAG